MVSVLDCGSSSPGLSPGHGHCVVLCSKARHFTLKVLLFTQVYKWVPEKMRGVTLQWTSIPSRREGGGRGVAILLAASC